MATRRGRFGSVLDMVDPLFYKGKKVLITGHTGFKGSWLSYILSSFGADVVGYALESPTQPSLFEVAGIGSRVRSVIGDIRDYDALKSLIEECQPEVVFHLAAQPLVLDGYKNPRYTYETNVMGTVNVLEAVRCTGCVKSLVSVTTDKVYLNEERGGYSYKEDDALNGYDPYSNSKSCADLATQSYAKSFLEEREIAVSAVRAGNVIGGGDFASNRIIPDCVRAVESGDPLVVRNPSSTRPYQHVLEPLFAYLLIAQEQYADQFLASTYNVGPEDFDCVTTEQLVGLFSQLWGAGFDWIDASGGNNAPHEATFLKLDSGKLKESFNWHSCWSIEDAVAATIEWTRVYLGDGDILSCMDAQIADYMRRD